MPYKARNYDNLIGMDGFSEILLSNHFKLYQGYVTNTNTLSEKLDALLKAEDFGPEYAELKRRFGFEFNGMRLHELYFEALGGDGSYSEDSEFCKAVTELFGGWDAWKQDFVKTGAMRGIGWVILYRDEMSGRLFNQWINEHEVGHLAGCRPLLVMDVFEHAFITDYGLNRAEYIEAFMKNVNWQAVAKRF
jgi:Fe-Mn family superoxide dismutase